jgi:hypothetical protein
MRIKIKWDRVIGMGVFSLMVGAMLYVGLMQATEPEPHEPAPVVTHTPVPRCTDAIADAGGICKGEPLPPCPTEDSDNCYWDAGTRGNGDGESFVTEYGITTYGDGRVVIWED